MSRYLMVIFYLIVFHTPGFSKEKLEWYEGKIELNDDEVIWGKISYNSTFDIVSVYKEEVESIKSFSATQVKHFEYYDDEYEIIRYFRSMEYQYSSLYKSKLFFETVLKGEITLVRRPTAFNQFYSLSKESLDENFGGYQYFVHIKGDFINLKRFKKQILPVLLEERKEDVIAFKEKYNLNLKNKDNQIIIIDYYNFLSDGSRKMEMDYIFSYN